jgi:hypothetical protein
LFVEDDHVRIDVAMGPASSVQLADLLGQLPHQQQAVGERPGGQTIQLLGQPWNDFKTGYFTDHRKTPSRVLPLRPPIQCREGRIF